VRPVEAQGLWRLGGLAAVGDDLEALLRREDAGASPDDDLVVDEAEGIIRLWRVFIRKIVAVQLCRPEELLRIGGDPNFCPYRVGHHNAGATR
jgi:hypothetical protein